jgi:hypothetical protein
MTPLLLELQARGHDVHLRTAASRVELMRALGFHTDAIDPAIPAVIHPDWEASNLKQALEVAISTFCQRGAIDGPDFHTALDEVAPGFSSTSTPGAPSTPRRRGAVRGQCSAPTRRRSAPRARRRSVPGCCPGADLSDAFVTPWCDPS